MRTNGLTGSASYDFRPPTKARGRERSVWPPSDELPHIWAHGQAESGRAAGTRVFFENGTIYSYGHHFPMARRVSPLCFFVNPATYSVSTSRHQSEARRAIPQDAKVFEIPPSADGSTRATLWDDIQGHKWQPFAEWTKGAIIDAATAATALRIRAATRAGHLERINALVAQWRDIHALFNFRCSVDQVKTPDTGDPSAIRAEVDANADRIARQAAASKRKAEKAAAERCDLAERLVLPKWRKGGPDTVERGERYARIRDLGYPVLRLDPEDKRWVQTSYGARVTAKHARASYLDLSGATMAPTVPLNGFGVPSITPDGLSIGCHQIPWSEVAAFGAYAGWPVFVAPSLPAAVS